MVTGIETAGLILGSIPLIIEGLKTYQKGIKSVKRSAKYDKLLSGAYSESEDYIELGDDFWTGFSTGMTNQAVKDYLGERKQQYFHDLLDEFERYFAKLGNALNHVERAGKNNPQRNHLTLSDLHSLAKLRDTPGKHVSKRVWYLIKEQDITELIEELDAINVDMDRLLAHASILAQHKNIQESRIISDERHAKALASLLNQIRNYADRLFNALLSAWIPGCHASHNVALFLDKPTVPKSGHPSSESSFKFRVIICGKPEDGVAVTHGICSPAQPVTTQTPVTPAITVTLLNQASTSVVLGRVTNLCDAAISAKQTLKRLGLILRNGTSLMSDNRSNEHCESALWSTINLESFLSTNRMGPAQKVKLALKLAISLLQFKSSQWFQSSISAQVIHFRKAVQAGRAHCIEVDQPLVLQSFCDRTLERSAGHKPRQMLLELGILFMEIWNGETMAAFAKRHYKIDDVPPLMRQGIATEWYEETWEQMTNNYGGVVNTCMAFALDYNRGMQTWEDEDLRKSVCAKIISWLNEDCLAFP
ncbi:uncharacterized protein BDZ99DRAFT_525713 [Mytilinidion resinicola]|uniref:DUF7580 domain-containing protein n=1 Tax=Mytilinidion resinicola TaxID=574789 RepID=A0A6A6Y8Q3_9PEZI|nr:uncharacterized protein BDZ99DRAFT_525713 [Mytilinidion resinicola]KAF2804505.1 hypothetical protein BDZ99DRAFT_525713 [Mytilinidion resinicola]